KPMLLFGWSSCPLKSKNQKRNRSIEIIMVDFQRYSVLLTDLDNTLYDWTSYFVPSFRAMVVCLNRETGESIDNLMADFASVFRRHGSVEYSFAIEELQTLARLHPNLTPN